MARQEVTVLGGISNGICDRSGSEGACSQRGKEGKANRVPNDKMHENAMKWIQWKCTEIERVSETLTIPSQS
jgi:hypothetical protein